MTLLQPQLTHRDHTALFGNPPTNGNPRWALRFELGDRAEDELLLQHASWRWPIWDRMTRTYWHQWWNTNV